MAERKKLELEINKPMQFELLYDQAVVGQSKFGDYFLYSVKDSTGTEFSFFAPEEVHNEICKLRKGERFQITKLAEQNGKKIITKYEVKLPAKPTKNNESDSKANGNGTKDPYFEIMAASFEDAIKIQQKIKNSAEINRNTLKTALTLFIARSKINGNGYN